MKRYLRADPGSLPGTPCTCGTARPAFADDADRTASIHVVDLERDLATRYHEHRSGGDVVLEGEGHFAFDGEFVAVKPVSAIMIKPGCRHRAEGRLRIIEIPVPAVDLAAEWLD